MIKIQGKEKDMLVLTLPKISLSIPVPRVTANMLSSDASPWQRIVVESLPSLTRRQLEGRNPSLFIIYSCSMSFVGDSDSAFLDHFTLGVPRSLEKIRGVQDVELEKRMPCERVLLSSWEQRHCCTLPEDIKNFYLSSDGFHLIWNFEYAGEVLPIGNMKINSISELRRIAGLKNFGDMDSPNLLDIEMCTQGATNAGEIQKPNFGTKCKLFELDPCQDIGKVCLVYIDKQEGEQDLKREDPKIWLLDRSFEWHFLAPCFTNYYRMMLMHLGLPQWQLRYTPMGLTPWAEQMFAMIAPHLLQPNMQKCREADWIDAECNQLDPLTFKPQKRNIKKKTETSK